MTAAKPVLEDIRLAGKIVIGTELQPQQPLTADQQEPGASPSTHESVPLFPMEWSLIGQRAPYKLEEANPPAELAVEGRGLSNAYGIFGAPGTGKSHLLLYMLRQIFRYSPANPETRFGCLILDPKAALIDKLEAAVPRIRKTDVLVLRSGGLPEPLNIIDCALPASELARILVLAAQAAGVAAMEPFWFLSWTNLFSAAITLLQYQTGFHVTLRGLLDAVLHADPHSELRGKTVIRRSRSGASVERPPRIIEVIAENTADKLSERVRLMHDECGLPEQQVHSELVQAIQKIRSFYATDYVHTIDEFIVNAYGDFQTWRYAEYSRSPRPLGQPRQRGIATNLYDSIIEDGRIVIVGVGPSQPGASKVLCTLVKCLFQQAVMSRRERCLLPHSDPYSLRNFKRPVLIACDEYAEVASEVPGQPSGDGRFFSLARENSCMGLLATQSVHVLQNSSLKDAWRSVFSNFAAKIFMGAADNETAKEASELAGQVDWNMGSWSTGMSQSGPTAGMQHQIRERPALPTYILTQVLRQGEAAIIGSLDGRMTPPAVRFVKVPSSANNIAGA